MIQVAPMELVESVHEGVYDLYVWRGGEWRILCRGLRAWRLR